MAAPIRMPVWAYRVLIMALISMGAMNVQLRGQPGAPPSLTPKAAAAIDLTGYWVSLVTEDWRYRMAVPPKGDFVGVPVNQAAKDAANAWDAARDESAGEQCKAYGVGGLMRVPTRLNISWQDEATLKLETDAGMQTRVLNFKPSQNQGGDWQGVSLANWDRQVGAMGPGRDMPPGGALKVITTKMKPGYLRKNGVPYSANAVVTEYFERFDQPNGGRCYW